MNYQYSIIISTLLLLVFLFKTEKGFAQKGKEQPNILIFIADDAGSNDFGVYGNASIKTPNIDGLAKTGLLFNNAFLTSSQCSPSRTSILSGQFAHTIGTEDLHNPLDKKTKLLPYYLKKEGYYTGLLMKSHLGTNGDKQFDKLIKGKDSESPRLFKEFLDAADNKPFFCWVGFKDPHRPYGDNKDGAPEVHKPEEVIVPPYFLDAPATRKDLAQYYDEIHRMDKNIGAMLKELEDRELRENTLVIFLSDNGMPFPRAKATLYDFGIKTPLIINWKGKVTEGGVYDELVSVIDLAPTILNAIGIETPDEMYGESIAKTFKDQSMPGREFVFSERNWHDTDEHMRCVRTKDYKLIVNGYPELLFPITSDFRHSGTWWDLYHTNEKQGLNDVQSLIFEFPRFKVEIYDIKKDVLETKNLSGSEEILPVGEALMMALNNWRSLTNDYPSFLKRRNDYCDRKTSFRLVLKWYDLYDKRLDDYWDGK